MMHNPRIIFMGTPGFAVATLGSLIMNGFNVAGVVTAPDKPAGRGRKMKVSAVREYAEFYSLPVMQPENLKDPAFISRLKEFRADLFIVVAFRMLPEVVWRMPPLGTINLHASLLPDYRGAAPINHVLINGETRSGVTTFFIDDKIDTGSILFREEVPVFAFDNAGDLHDRLMKLGARLMIKTINELIGNRLKPIPQSELLAAGQIPKPAPKIRPEDCIIKWDSTPDKIYNLIRGLAPFPGARSSFMNEQSAVSFKIFESQPLIAVHSFDPGQLITDGKNYLRVACRDGFVNILLLQAEGRKTMNITEFLRGFRIGDYSDHITWQV
jgi:methionyl-tRNA formyltransferase